MLQQQLEVLNPASSLRPQFDVPVFLALHKRDRLNECMAVSALTPKIHKSGNGVNQAFERLSFDRTSRSARNAQTNDLVSGDRRGCRSGR